MALAASITTAIECSVGVATVEPVEAIIARVIRRGSEREAVVGFPSGKRPAAEAPFSLQ
jgi:hypothetical protein